MSATIRMASPPKTTETQWPWHPCPTCWSQGVVWERSGVITDGETGDRKRLYFGTTCTTCMGVGSVPESFEV